MKIKDLIKHLQTLDQEKELVIIATDPTDWDYGKVVNPDAINLETIMPTDENGLEGEVEMPVQSEEEENINDEVECYVIRLDC